MIPKQNMQQKSMLLMKMLIFPVQLDIMQLFSCKFQAVKIENWVHSFNAVRDDMFLFFSSYDL